MKNSLSENNKLRLSVAFFGLCIGLFTLYTEGLINRDGVLYIQTAQIYDESGIAAAFKHYGWPFYSIAIAVCHSMTTLTFENSAQLLNLIFLLLLVDAFVRLYWEVNSKVNYRWMPAVIILAYTGLNDYRPMIIRDWGYWGFLFLALLYFIKAYKYEKLSSFVLWQICIVLAFLFRIEAIVCIILLPFLFLFKKKSIVSFFYSGFILLLPLSIMLFLTLTGYKGGRVSDILVYMDMVSYWNHFVDYAQHVAKYALRHHAESNAILFVLSGLLGVFIVKTIAKLGVLYIGIGLIGQFRYRLLKSFQCSFINLMLAISCLIFFIYFCYSKVIAGRYTIQITLFLLLYVTYYSEFILDELMSLGRPLLLGLFGCAFFINFVVGIYHSDSKKLYIKTMGDWVNNNLIDTARVTTNDERLYYYSGGVLKNNMTNSYSLKNNEYALLRIKEGDKQYDKLINEGKLVMLHTVIGRSKDSAVLFKINTP